MERAVLSRARMRATWILSLLLLGCSSTQTSADAGDAGCPSGPTSLNGGAGSDYGVPVDPKTNACPASYCWACDVLDWPNGCNATLCLDHAPHSAEQGQCQMICDAGTD
jgi:hypothetical protein